MNGTVLGTLALGFVLGVRHSLDGDHLVAISTIVSRERSIWRSSIVGAVWGMGHTTSLFVAAVAVIFLRLTISPRAALSIEFGVGLMLILLGLDLLRRLARGDFRLHSHAHRHDGHEHVHLHVHGEPFLPPPDSHHHVGKRPFFIGLVHGLAGSAALMLFVLTTISSPWIALLYVLVFGVGTIGGMLVMSSLIGLPLTLASRFVPRVVGTIQLATGIGSVGYGVLYAWRIGWIEGLLR
jgi:sulfite exporter TauE/SafE